MRSGSGNLQGNLQGAKGEYYEEWFREPTGTQGRVAGGLRNQQGAKGECYEKWFRGPTEILSWQVTDSRDRTTTQKLTELLAAIENEVSALSGFTSALLRMEKTNEDQMES